MSYVYWDLFTEIISVTSFEEVWCAILVYHFVYSHELLNINCLQISVLYMSMMATWCPHTALIALVQQQFTPRVSNINRIADGGSFAMAIICTLICIHTKWTPLCLLNCIYSQIPYKSHTESFGLSWLSRTLYVLQAGCELYRVSHEVSQW